MEGKLPNNRLQQVEAFWQKVCFDPQFEPEGRFSVYRDLCFSTMLEVLSSICPVARSLFAREQWESLFWEYLKTAPPKSPILRELPKEVAEFFKRQDFSLKSEYPYLGELMEYEYAEIQVRFAPEDEEKTPDKKIRLNPAYFLGKYQWPVHYIGQRRFKVSELPKGQYYLLLWRDPVSLEVQFMELSPLVVALLQKITIPQEPSELLEKLVKDLNIAADQRSEFFKEANKLFPQWSQQGLLV